MEAFSNLVEHKIVKTSIFTNSFQYFPPRKIKLFYQKKKNRLKSKSWTILSQFTSHCSLTNDSLVTFEFVILNIWSSNRRNSNKRYKHFLALNLFYIYSVPRTRLKEILGFWYRSFGQNFSWLMTCRSFYLDSTCFLLCDFLS